MKYIKLTDVSQEITGKKGTFRNDSSRKKYKELFRSLENKVTEIDNILENYKK